MRPGPPSSFYLPTPMYAHQKLKRTALKVIPRMPAALRDADTPNVQLPLFTPMAAPTFIWGDFEAAELIEILESTYAEAIHWRFNLLKVPYGAAGKAFVSELAQLFRTFGEASALESVAMKAATSHPYHSPLFTKYIFFFISSSFINSCPVHVYLRTMSCNY